jgi:hypothetical protein
MIDAVRDEVVLDRWLAEARAQVAVGGQRHDATWHLPHLADNA